MSGIVDFHSHLIPGVDDGAADVAQSINALHALAAEGVRTVVTTPHLDATLTLDPDLLEQRLAEIDAGWEVLLAAAESAGHQGVLKRGVELSLDTPTPDVSDSRLRLAGGSFVLMEFPFMAVPPHSARALSRLRDLGVIPVIAHPERYRGVTDLEASARAWREAGAYLQVNGASLLGRYGLEARARAELLLARGLADYLASDYHARGGAGIALYEEHLMNSGGEEQAVLLMRTNPERIILGRAPLPVPALNLSRGAIARFLDRFR